MYVWATQLEYKLVMCKSLEPSLFFISKDPDFLLGDALKNVSLDIHSFFFYLFYLITFDWIYIAPDQNNSHLKPL